MENNQVVTIFNSVQIESKNSYIDNLLTNLTYEQGVFLITEAVKSAHKKGIFTLLESEIISKSLRKIYEVKEPEEKSETN